MIPEIDGCNVRKASPIGQLISLAPLPSSIAKVSAAELNLRIFTHDGGLVQVLLRWWIKEDKYTGQLIARNRTRRTAVVCLAFKRSERKLRDQGYIRSIESKIRKAR